MLDVVFGIEKGLVYRFNLYKGSIVSIKSKLLIAYFQSGFAIVR